MSDDGRHGLTIIAFIGSVFSPYYAFARGGSDGLAAAEASNHCAINVALYGPRRHLWCMTERGRASLLRSPELLRIGPSSIERRDGGLSLHLDEIAAPWPRRVRGTVRVHIDRTFDDAFALDADGRHRWRPIAPCARVDLDCEAPALRWSGSGYFDGNDGDCPLEQDFASWQWSRARLRDGRCAVLYDVLHRDGSAFSLARSFDAARGAQAFVAPPGAALPAARWRIPRTGHSDAGTRMQVHRTLEDGPFYARTLLGAHWLGEPVVAIHESLSLDRFRKPWVRALLPFRMPRALR